eukprot:GHVU01217674.1.p1 GENE.GHVU01217674.1~~GHVU01217674.1.p1  ORF type:complete len:239 (-),score=15.68 GHVU01217674.1:866-1516(-)
MSVASDTAPFIGGANGTKAPPTVPMTIEDRVYEKTEEARDHTRNLYGIPRIIPVIQNTDPDLNMLALGTNIPELGVDVADPNPFFTQVSVPWCDHPFRPQLKVPACYENVTMPKYIYMSKLQEDTLLYIFYHMPQNVLQVYSAVELCRRGYKYHRYLRKWYSVTPGNEPGDGTIAAEQWKCFESATWQFKSCPRPDETLLLEEADIPLPTPPSARA